MAILLRLLGGALVWTLVGCATLSPPSPPPPSALAELDTAPPRPEPSPDPISAPAPSPAPEPAAEPEPPPPPACALNPITLAAPPTATIEDPHGVMTSFYAQMSETLLETPGAITRIGHWSDSTLASDGVSSFARRRLQSRYGDAGHGFVLPVRSITHYAHRDVQRWSGGRWLNIPLVGGKTRDGRYGLGGWVSIGRKGAWAAVGTAGRRSPVGHNMSKLHLYYLAAPHFGSFTVRLDGEPFTTVSTAAEERHDAMTTLTVPDGPHRLSLRVSTAARVRLFGVALEREGPGFVYDSFGILGALARRFSRVDRPHWKAHLGFRAHDLMMIQYGGNSIQDGGLNYTRYRSQFRALVRLFRDARPEAACLVLSPHDHGRRRGRGVIDTDPKLHKLLPLQREVALEEGCAWFSVFDAMGGEGSMGRYHRTRKAYADLRHLRFRGAKAIAHHIVDAFEQGFNDYLERLSCPAAIERSVQELRVESHLE